MKRKILLRNKFQSKGLFLIASLILITSCKTHNSNNVQLPKKEFFVFTGKKYYKQAERLRSKFLRRAKLGGFNGVVLFAQDDNIIFEKAIGYANFGRRKRLKLNTAFQLASVGKTITSAAVLRLAALNKLNLNDSLGKFFPGFPYKNITVKELLSHRSGLPEYMYLADSLWQDKRNVCLRNPDVLDLLYEYRPRRYYPPGRRYNYSNTNYALLSLIVEKVSGVSFEEFLKKEIFKPAGMRNTFIKKCNSDNGSNVAIGYIHWRRRVYDYYLDGVKGDKGIYSTVEDLFKFDKALNKGRILPDSLIKQAFSPLSPDLYKWDNYGLGWRINIKKNGEKIVFHTGWWKGFRTDYIKCLRERKTIILLSNRSDRGIIHSSELTGLFGVDWYE